MALAVQALLDYYDEVKALFGPILLVSESLSKLPKGKRGGPALNCTLNSFAYARFKSILAHRLLERGIPHVQANPAYTSKLGQSNYASPYGLSVDSAASVVIARNAYNYPHRLRPSIAVRAQFTLPRSEWLTSSDERVNIRSVTSLIGGRKHSYSHGLLTRVQVVLTKPPIIT